MGCPTAFSRSRTAGWLEMRHPILPPGPVSPAGRSGRAGKSSVTGPGQQSSARAFASAEQGQILQRLHVRDQQQHRLIRFTAFGFKQPLKRSTVRVQHADSANRFGGIDNDLSVMQGCSGLFQIGRRSRMGFLRSFAVRGYTPTTTQPLRTLPAISSGHHSLRSA